MSYQYPAVGTFYPGNGMCSFTVWAPQRESVELLLHGKRKAVYPLSRDERGYWFTELKGIPPGTLYSFRLDHDRDFPDPASLSQPQGVHGPSAVVDRSFLWTDTNWKGIPLEEMILYELHVGTFTPEGNFEGVIARLDYLKALGINTIELMPVAQFPGERNWGYDGVFPFAVQHSYGGVTGLKKLVNEAHRKDLAVVLDVVYNHLGPEGNYLAEFAPYFTDKYKTFWGKAINFDDAWCDGVRHFYWQNALTWLDEFHIDGLRLDAVHAIRDFSASHFLQKLSTKVAHLENLTGSHKVLIAELDLNDPRYIDPSGKGGYGLDGQWIDEFHHALHALITGERNGYYEDFGEAWHLAKSLKDSYVYTGQYSVHRKRLFGRLPRENPYTQFVVFDQNHDQVGNRMLGERLSVLTSFEGLKLAAAAFLLSPHVPMLFMGEEYGEKNPFLYFISHTDPDLINAVREGRRREFAQFAWEGEVPDAQAEETFRKSVLSWDLEQEPGKTLHNYYRYLIHFRKTRTAMQGRQRNTARVYPPTMGKVIGFERKYAQDWVLIVLNFEKETATFSQPIPYTLKKIFDSSVKAWHGPGERTPGYIARNSEIVLNPESVVIFET